MSHYDSGLRRDVDLIEERVMTDPVGVLDRAEEQHHEFVRGGHGLKLNFDAIKEGTDFYIDLVSAYARSVLARYGSDRPDAFVGVASGANRFSRDITHFIGGGIINLATIKNAQGVVELDTEAKDRMASGGVDFAVAIDDVGTTGSTTATVVTALRERGAKRIEVMNFWQRSEKLSHLDELDVPYHSVIKRVLPTYSFRDCETLPEGYCRRGVFLVKHTRS